MDGFTGFKTATADALPDAVAVMDPLHPFHVVRVGPRAAASISGTDRRNGFRARR